MEEVSVTRNGCDIMASQVSAHLRHRKVALLANPASVSGEIVHTSRILQENGINLVCLFGPQHGYRGETQANMIEWRDYAHPDLDIPVYSLYGSTRTPLPAMLEGIDTMVIDLPDTGARPYTYIWTALLTMRACSAADVNVLVLDRPNPVGGLAVEGPLLEERFHSFVGMFPLPLRHGMTIAEILSMINQGSMNSCRLEIVRMKKWKRSMFFEETELPWILPSPNIPHPGTALVYSGMVLLEGTNISEGRGTTRPFEIVGAPWIDPESFARQLSAAGMEGVIFQPFSFLPTADKYAGELCGGVHLHVNDRKAFRPVRCAARIISLAARLYPDRFGWHPPPYEYEETLMPIDIISGSSHLREHIDAGEKIDSLFESWREDEDRFSRERRRFLLYR
ncbi:MAG: DUF1343 domain-containing protein [Candidatus Krumholzibacteriota bacterium]|nr:DUF1343 domain-containing protein [Candidatus Krumholzibacteriota bacterium]